MAMISGIGGFFFRADDPDGLSVWYDHVFGITPVPPAYDAPVWMQEAGPTVFAPFARDTDYFGRPEQGWMLNFRVADLDAAVETLKGQGIAVAVDPESYPNGRFARLHDPEGNPIELWQPL